MRHFDFPTSAISAPRTAVLKNVAFAAVLVGIGTIAVAGTSAASEGAPAVEASAEVATDRTFADAPPPVTVLDKYDAAPLVEPVVTKPQPTTPEPATPKPVTPTPDPVPVPPVDVFDGLGDAPTGCAAGCITDVTVDQIAVASTDMLLAVHTDTPAEVIVAIMALEQGEDPVGGDPYAASHGLVTNWTIELVDLLPGTTYEYAVIAIDGHGGTDSHTGTFTTAMQLTGEITAETPVEICTIGCSHLQHIAALAPLG